MKKKIFSMIMATTMVITSFSAMASDTTAETVATEDEIVAVVDTVTEEGWLTVDINGEPEEFQLQFVTVGLTGKTYHFESDEFTMSIVFDRNLAIGETVGMNSIYQIDLLSSNESSSGYYFSKKTVTADVDSEVTLSQKTDDGLLEGTFRVTVPTAERYVGDARPGMLEQLTLENGAFSLHG